MGKIFRINKKNFEWMLSDEDILCPVCKIGKLFQDVRNSSVYECGVCNRRFMNFEEEEKH